MAPPQLFINTKTLELEKQQENKSSEDFEPENKHGKDENRSFPILAYVVCPILVFTDLAIAFVGVSSNKNDSLLKCYYLIFPGLSMGR